MYRDLELKLIVIIVKTYLMLFYFFFINFYYSHALSIFCSFVANCNEFWGQIYVNLYS